MKKTSALLAFILFLGTCGLLFAKSDSVDVTEDSSSPLMMAEHEGPFKKAPNSDHSRTSGISEFELHQRAREATEPGNEARRENQSASLTPQENPSDSASSSTPPPRYKISRTTSLLANVNETAFQAAAVATRKMPTGKMPACNMRAARSGLTTDAQRNFTAFFQEKIKKDALRRIMFTQAERDKSSPFISVQKLRKMLVTVNADLETASHCFNSNLGTPETRTEAMKRFLTQLKQTIATADIQDANCSGSDAAQIKVELLSQIDLTKELLEGFNYSFIIGSGLGGAAGYAIPTLIYAAFFCNSAVPLALACPYAAPFTLAAGTIAAIGSYAYLKQGRKELYKRSLADMQTKTTHIQEMRERNRSDYPILEETWNLTLQLTTGLTHLAQALRKNY